MFQRIRTSDARIRNLPFPFLGAVSISSDVEYMSFEFFEVLMKFLNTRDSTPLGDGLGLEVTSSMFFYSVDSKTFSYFMGESHDGPMAPYALRINEYLSSGWIDTNHSFGDFFKSNKFTRDHANRSFNVLKNLNVSLQVFTNHGGNTSNLGKHHYQYTGDQIGTVAYHSDLLKKNGVSYVWLDSGPFIIEAQSLLGAPKYYLKQLVRRVDNQYLRGSNRLFKKVTLRDGGQFTGFVRLRSTGRFAPDFSSLSYQLNLINWDRMYKAKGVIILYQHLGVLTQNSSQCQAATVEDILRRKDVFMAPFYFLQNETRKGKLWVAGTARLLSYVDMIESVKLNYDEVRNQYTARHHSKALVDPQILFQGLTFYIDPNKPVELYGNGKKLNIEYNGPDETRRYSVSVPLQPLRDIWK